MTGGDDQRRIADLIDALLAAEKVLVGTPSWGDGTRGSDKRFDWPVLVADETADCRVSATAYPEEPDLRFTITLNFRDLNIWRVDHEPTDLFDINPIQKGHPHSGKLIQGPHCHPWDINRHEATPSRVPNPLRWRRPLPTQAQGWENVFRWFLGETNIVQPDNIPGLPERVRLL